jgi:hypothetical protein
MLDIFKFTSKWIFALHGAWEAVIECKKYSHRVWEQFPHQANTFVVVVNEGIIWNIPEYYGILLDMADIKQ